MRALNENSYKIIGKDIAISNEEIISSIYYVNGLVPGDIIHDQFLLVISLVEGGRSEGNKKATPLSLQR